MSPIAEPTVLDLRAYTLRHVGPRAVVFPDTPGQDFTLLNRSDLVARPLPTANIPNSVDFVQGKWTGRLYDAGDAQLIFPNKEASDGAPWRYRFDPTSKLQWIEFWVDEYLEFVGVITKVTPDRNQVVVDLYDGLQMTKSAYDRDVIEVCSPRDTIERGTQLWVPTTTDNFPAGSLNAQWTTSVAGGGTVSIGPAGGLQLAIPTGAGLKKAWVQTGSVAVPSGTQAWRAICQISSAVIGTNNLALNLVESTGDQYEILFYKGVAQLILGVGMFGSTMAQAQVPTGPSYTLMLESDGEWISGFVNGQLIGCFRRNSASTSSIQTEIQLETGGGTDAANVSVASVLTESLQPYLMR